MIAQPCRLYIACTDPAKDLGRFCAMAIEPTLFGEVLDPTRGRIGAAE